MKNFVLGMLLFSMPVSSHAGVGLKSGLSYLYSLSDVTSVPIRDTVVAATYTRVKSRLPINGNFSELTEPVMFGMTSLAGDFCRRMVDTDMQSSNVFARPMSKGVLFNLGPSAIPQDYRERMISDHSNYFFGREPSPQEKDLMLNYMSDVAKMMPDTGKSTEELVITTCLHFATSLEFLME